MKKSIAFILVFTLVLGLLAGCSKNKVLTADEAVNVVLEDLGVTAEEVSDVHVHVAAGDVPGYSIYLVVGDEAYDYTVAAATGEILSSGHSDGHAH